MPRSLDRQEGVLARRSELFGLIDDVSPLSPRTKLAGQIVAAVVICRSGVTVGSVRWVFTEEYITFGWLDYPITIVYFLIFMNAINLIDGLDGLKADERDYVCVLTRGHMFDPQGCLWGVRHNAHYVGMMGCAGKNNTVHDLDNENEHMKMIAAGGFRDITRIASSSPEMWEQICVDNHENISDVMDVFISQLIQARDHMCSGDGGYINRMFAASREYRDSFSFASIGPVKNMYMIYCDVIDENGAIATIATILAVHGISIKNIRIVHNREHDQGALAIEFYKKEAMDSSIRILRHHRYRVTANE